MSNIVSSLEVIIFGRDQFSATAAKVTGGVRALEAAAGRTGGAFTLLSGKLGHAKSAIGGLLTGPLGVIGLTGGLFSLGGAVESSLRHTSDFGLALEKLTTLTGESAQQVGGLLLTFEKFNVSADQTAQIVGFAEKTLGNLAAGGGAKLLTFQKEFGISLVDNKGKVVDFSTELARVADYYQSSATESSKAAVAAHLFGRGYATIIPILKLGSAGIQETADQAKALGLTLDATNVKQISDYRQSIRSLGESLGILQLKIGLALIPAIKGLADSVTSWLSNGGAEEISSFFKKGAQFAQQFGDAVQHFVLPIFGAIGQAWNAVPGPLKDLLIGGFAINKAGKFLFGSSLVGGAKGLLESILGRVPGASAVVGVIDPGQRVFVTNWPLGGIGGGIPGAAVGAGEAAAGAGGVAAAAGISGAAVAAGAIAVVALGLIGDKLLVDELNKTPKSFTGPAQFTRNAGGALVPINAPGAQNSLLGRNKPQTGGLSPTERQERNDAAQALQDRKDADQSLGLLKSLPASARHLAIIVQRDTALLSAATVTKADIAKVKGDIAWTKSHGDPHANAVLRAILKRLDGTLNVHDTGLSAALAKMRPGDTRSETVGGYTGPRPPVGTPSKSPGSSFQPGDSYGEGHHP